MSRVFPKLIRSISMACKEGGADPDSNAKLRSAIAYAKAQNMPKDNIDNAIKRAISKDAEDYQEISYEGKGPHGVLIFVDCATDNPTRTVANIKTIFNKQGGQVLESGALSFMFNRKAVIEFVKPEGQEIEEIELELIDAGLEELDVEDESCLAYGDYTAFNTLTKACESMGLEIKKANLQMIASSPVEFSAEQIAEIEPLLDKLEDDEDVQEVYTNIA